MKPITNQHRPGIILLVVLSMLTFFSLLVAAYLVFSNQARQTSFAISTRNIKQPNPNELLNESLMLLLRGTDDPFQPFFGEDLLSDYYGRNDAIAAKVLLVSTVTPNQGFIRFTLEEDSGSVLSTNAVNDLYAGRVITFLTGNFTNRSYRVLRSIAQASSPVRHDLIFQQDADLGSTALAVGDRLHINGVPRNSPGIGFDSGAGTISKNAIAQPNPNPGATGNVGYTLPAALQPNHLGRGVDKSSLLSDSDYDESYDAPDYFNWFLSYRHDDGKIIPSFHRPSVINYILNQNPSWTTITPADRANIVASLARGTFRPLPIHKDQFQSTGGVYINQGFTGGNQNFALRSPLYVSDAVRLDQLAKVLTGSVTNPWDVDNDGDGMNDSVWIDVGLPVFASPEGKLLKPLVAVMIEDLSARLNVNAHHNVAITAGTVGLSSDQALWAGTRGAFTVATTGSPNTRNVFRGLGFGPAEIALPETALEALVNLRYQTRSTLNVVDETPGTDEADELDTLRTGFRPRIHTAGDGYGYSVDPFGHGGIGIGRNGQLVAALSGRQVRVDNTGTTSLNELTDENINDPYESDPSGRLRGDALFTPGDLEAMLRSNDFDIDMLPQRLRDQLLTLPGYVHRLTTSSVSDDTPPALVADANESFYENWVQSLITSYGVPVGSIPRLVAPELRLGRKLDVNRPFGNGVDDNANGTIDEPLETQRADSTVDTNDNDMDGTINQLGETFGERQAFASVDTTNAPVPVNYALAIPNNAAPNYTADEPATTTAAQIPVNGRQLFARHLYVLMMALTDGYTFPVTDMTVTDQANYRARRIAQWAVNVVDYRDADSIMTRFVFDYTPFDATGWSPPVDTTATPAPAANVVWGVEAPELVISEGSAYHDVRLKDTNLDSGEGERKGPGATDTDNDTDQVRIPQGSLFLELYCPRSAVDSTSANDQSTKPGVPRELYDIAANGSAQLDLGQIAPSPGGTSPGVPVWRIALSQPHFAARPGRYLGTGIEDRDPATARTARQDTASIELGPLDELDDTTDVLAADRFIWFTNHGSLMNIADTINDNNISDMIGPTAASVFFAPNSVNGASRTLEAGQFLTIAPRLATNFGSYSTTGALPDRPSQQRLVTVAGEGVIHFGQDNVRRTPAIGTNTSYAPALPLVVGTFPPTGWPATVFENGIVGVNVSEPLPNSTAGYYPQPLFQYLGPAGMANYPLFDAYVDLSLSNKTARDTPVDVAFGRIPVSTSPAPAAVSADPVEEPALGTIPQYCSAFLQRLADPLLPYNAITNPYRTVDWTEIDLTVFSGEDRADKMVTASDYTRRTRQKNGFINGAAENVLHSYETDFVAPAISVDAIAQDYFSFSASIPAVAPIQSSLSFLNTADPVSNPGFNGFSPSIGSEGPSGVLLYDRNLPNVPYAQHPWFNRPFASHFELMMVPACSQARLFDEFRVVDAATPPINYPTVATDLTMFQGAYRHLLNFFHSAKTSTDAAQFERIFDYVHTLPRFRGEVEVILPSRVPIASPLAPLYRAPFGLIYDNRRQGRINLNTIADFEVWKGLMQGHLNSDEYSTAAGLSPNANQLSFNSFLASRRGFPMEATGNPVTGTAPFNYDTAHMHSMYPTEFAGVFRDALTTPLAVVPRDAATAILVNRRPINGTLLRGTGLLGSNDPGDPGAVAEVGPAFVRDNTQIPTPPVTLHLDRNRNTFARYQTLMRMPNLAADNSQTFLIRVTMGMFEVDASDTNNLGAEYNEGTGQNQRYQALFMVDRSIPVGFIPGQDLNAHNAVIFERFYQ